VIVGVSPAIRRALALAERYARTQLPVLLVGATGTGKELFAEHIHERSGRPGPLVDVNCGALPREMVESLLFGHQRGAFTGAIDSKVGHVERSDGGTLFLDELESLATDAQGKLLRVLETGSVQPLGAPAKRRVDLRIVSAVQDGIGDALSSGRFRRDLFQRVAGLVIELPPLSARPEDVLPLARYFAGLRNQRLDSDGARALLNYRWPGNVRELRLTIERAGQLGANGTISAGAVVEAIALGSVAQPVALGYPDERTRLLRTCEDHRWNAAATAKALGISRTTLHRRLRELGLSLRHAKKYTFTLASEQPETSDCATTR
jgi:transcriptional regulator with PAS, ATPase and Fis domain